MLARFGLWTIQNEGYESANCIFFCRSNKEHIQLAPHESYQFLFCLSQKTSELSLATTIGRLDMCARCSKKDRQLHFALDCRVWQSAFGEQGRLQTSQLTRVAPSYGDLRLLIDRIPGQVRLKQLFLVQCRVLNCRFVHILDRSYCIYCLQ